MLDTTSGEGTMTDLIETPCSGCGTKYEAKFIHPVVAKNAADLRDYCPFCYAQYLFRVGKE